MIIAEPGLRIRPGQHPQQAVVTRGPTLDANTLNEILRQLPLLPGL